MILVSGRTCPLPSLASEHALSTGFQLLPISLVRHPKNTLAVELAAVELFL